MAIDKYLKQLNDYIFGMEKKTPSKYAFETAKLQGTKNTYRRNAPLLELAKDTREYKLKLKREKAKFKKSSKKK